METITSEILTENPAFAWRKLAGVTALVCVELEREGFANAFSTRLGGVSALPREALNLAGFDDDTAENIYENRRRFVNIFGTRWHLMTAVQTHGADIHVVASRTDARADTAHADALATDLPNILLGVKTADCVPILLGDARTGACAAIPGGWRGTRAGIVTRAIDLMAGEFNTRPADLCAAIGPAALACCYEVGPEVIDAFVRKNEGAASLFTFTRDYHGRIDLHEANRRLLVAAGLQSERVHIAPLCTMCRTDLFFSYRRERPSFGRLLSVVGRSL
ncbi:MAG: peptidoglycan editing factor PgeF [Pyrinomonadaceae bacterium]